MIGKLVYNTFYKPTLPLRYNLSHFGVSGSFAMMNGERLMKLAAKNCEPLRLSSSQNALEVNFLTGNNYWHQTIFCIKSLAKYHGNELKINIYSDGSIDGHTKTRLSNFCKDLNFITDSDVNKRLDHYIPEHSFPTLCYLRKWHPFFRRMLDIHVQELWQMHLDSDMLFFDSPTELLAAARESKAIYMKEGLTNSYFVDTPEIIYEKFGMRLADKVNGGIVAYDGTKIELLDLEEKAGLIMREYPTAIPAMVEQTLMSYLLYQQGAEPLHEERYKIHYGYDDVNSSSCVKHYIFKSKLAYLCLEWKKVMV